MIKQRIGRSPRWKAEDGLTLIELMMAAGVVLVGIVMAMSAIVTIAQTSASNEELAIARSHLATVAENLHNAPLETVLAYTPPALDGLGVNETVTVSIAQADGTLVETPVAADYNSGGLPNPLEVRIDVTWRTAAGRVITEQITTYVRR